MMAASNSRRTKIPDTQRYQIIEANVGGCIKNGAIDHNDMILLVILFVKVDEREGS